MDGVNCDAHLVFGFVVDNTKKFIDHINEQLGDVYYPPTDSWEILYANKHGIYRPDLPWEGNEEIFERYFKIKRGLMDKTPCDISFWGDSDKPIEESYVFVHIRHAMAPGCNPVVIAKDALDIPSEDIFELKAFCEILGIQYQEPQLLLISNYG